MMISPPLWPLALPGVVLLAGELMLAHACVNSHGALAVFLGIDHCPTPTSLTICLDAGSIVF